jgi:hypothetical protein
VRRAAISFKAGRTNTPAESKEEKRTMKKALSATVALLVAVVCSAFAQDVRYNFDKNTDFSKFKTYKWVQLKDAQQLDDLTDKQIKAALDKQLSAKGLTKSDSDHADLYIGYQAAVGQEKQFTSYNTGWGYGPGWGGWHGGMTSSTTYGQTSTIHTGQLALDMYDPANHDLVWRGVASKTLDPKAKPDKRQKNLDKTAAKLLKNYPPPAK